MISDRDIELAHPDAFDFAFGNLAQTKVALFTRHLGGCPHCQKVIDEYSDVGRIIQGLPPHVEPSADLEERTVSAMVAALAEQTATADRQPGAEDRTATRVYRIPGTHHPVEPQTRVEPVPQPQPPAEPETQLPQSPGGPPAPAEPQPRGTVTRLPVWRRYPRRLGAVVAVAAAIITAAVVLPLSLGGGRITPAQATVVIPLHVTAAAKVSGYGAATGQATARQDASGSWNITLTVHHLKHFDPEPWYGCWYVNRDGSQAASAGTFLVPDSGDGTFSMTSAVDPHDFSTMEITLQSPSNNGGRAGTVILSGQEL
jgi:hypothetical protein